MSGFWTVLGLEPTKDVSTIKRAYGEKAKTCHPEEDPEGFLELRNAYRAALSYAEGERTAFSKPGNGSENHSGRLQGEEDKAEEEDRGWQLFEEGPLLTENPYANSEAILKFWDLYTGKQRRNPKLWMEYFTSDAFLDAGWDARFTALLLEKITEAERTMPPPKEFLTWLSIAYQYSLEEFVRLPGKTLLEMNRDHQIRLLDGADFDGMESILRIARKGPALKKHKGNEFAILQSFRDYRHLIRLAEAGRWDPEALEGFRTVLNSYAPAYIRERCEQRVTPDCERHPAGLRVFLHFFQRQDLPEAVYRAAWQRLDLKSAIMGRAKALYGPLRELTVRRVPGIDGEAPPVNFLQLTRNLDAYLKRIRANPETEPAESEAFFASPEMRQALPVPRFLEQQLLTNSPWRREGMGEGLIRRLLDYYREHTDLPRGEEVVSGLEKDLRLCEAKRWSREDAQADPEGIPHFVRLSLAHRPLLRYWLNTAFYTAQDPETGTTLLEYLEKYLPYQESWSRRFAGREDGTPRTIAAAMGMVEIDCYPQHLEYRVNGKPVYRPCLTWEQTARESGDWFALLLPITAAPYGDFDKVAQEIYRRMRGLFLPEDEWVLIARCLAGHVCRLPLEDGSGNPVPPETVLPMELSAEGGGRLYTAVWKEDGEPVTIYRQTASGRREQERLEPDPEGNWRVAVRREEAAPYTCTEIIRFTPQSGLEAARQRLRELVSPEYFDVSRLRELPWHIYFTPNGGEEEVLTHIDLLQPEPKRDIAELWDLDEERGEAETPKPLSGEPETSATPEKLLSETEGAPPEVISPEKLVSRETLMAALGRFALGELERLEMEWMQGRLVLCHDGDKYACLYFENTFERGDYWYSLLSDREMYRNVGCGEIEYVPFGMGKLAVYSVFPGASVMMRDMDLVLGQMGWGKLEDLGGRLWSCNVNLHDSKHKRLMAQQKLGGVPPHRGRNYLLAKFVSSRFPVELETVDLEGERTVTALRSGAYGQANSALVRFMQEKLSRLRIAWAFQTPEGETERRHLILLRDEGKYMMLWLQEGKRLALAYASDAPVKFLGRYVPACLVHRDLQQRIRNGVDLLLDDLDNTEPVVSRPGEFVPLPYEEVQAALVGTPI